MAQQEIYGNRSSFSHCGRAQRGPETDEHETNASTSESLHRAIRIGLIASTNPVDHLDSRPSEET
jgi:hypothetical protein